MSLDSIAITNFMHKDIIVAEQDLNMIGLSRIMSNNDIGSVIIVDDLNTRKPVGIITERDVIRAIGTLQPDQLIVPVREHMSHPLITLSSNATISDALKLMYERKIRRVVIIDHNKLVGILTDKDIFRALIQNKDLLTNVITGINLPIPENQMKDDISQFWFFNNFIR